MNKTTGKNTLTVVKFGQGITH